MEKPDLNQTQYNIKDLYIQQYERYLPTAFDESLSLLEKVNKVIWQLNQLGEVTDDLLNKWNKIIKWILNDGLTEIVQKQLEKWLNDGTLETIIGDVLDDVTQQVEDMIKELEELRNSLTQKSHGAIYQKKLMYPDFHENGPIFEGAQRANQGMAYIDFEGQEKIFMVSRVRGSSWDDEERQVITEFNMRTDGGYADYISHSEVLKLAHQGISAFEENGQIVLITGGHTGGGNNASKGYAKVYWKGKDTTNNDVVTFRLFGNTETDHPLHYFNHGTPCVTKDGKYIVIATSATFPGGLRYCFVYDRKEVESQGNPENTEPLNSFKIQPPPYIWGNVVQDIASDGYYIYIASGNPDPKKPNMLTIHRIDGQYEGYTRIDGSIGDYTIGELEGNTDLGIPVQLEPEGLSIRGNNLLFQTTDVWKTHDESDYTKREKVIHEITKNPEGADPINRGWQSFESPASLHLHANSNDITVERGDALQFSDFDSETYEMRELFGYHAQHNFYIYDVRDGANGEQHASIAPYFTDDSQYTIFRSDRNNSSGAGFTAHTTKDKSNPGTLTIQSVTPDGESNKIAFYGETGIFAPSGDNHYMLGSPNHLWETVYAQDGTINTSDRNAKESIKPIDDNVLDAWEDIEYSQFQFKKSVVDKGKENARIHIGIIAQHICEVFKKHGLNAFDYGLVGYDEWQETPEKRSDLGEILVDYQPAGSAYNIRADECQFLEMALMRRELNKLKK